MTYVAASFSAKLSFPLPFLRGFDSWIMQNLRSHIFLDFGSISAMNQDGWNLKNSIWNTSSMAAGAGVVLRLGEYGRAELNYCVPVRPWRHIGGLTAPGLQLGIGVTML